MQTGMRHGSKSVENVPDQKTGPYLVPEHVTICQSCGTSVVGCLSMWLSDLRRQAFLVFCAVSVADCTTITGYLQY